MVGTAVPLSLLLMPSGPAAPAAEAVPEEVAQRRVRSVAVSLNCAGLCVYSWV
jgi:hypothetical protein